MNIPTSLIVVLLVVAWLVVLVPMIARRRERVPRIHAVNSGLRVLRRASASLRRGPRRLSRKKRAHRDADRSEEALMSESGAPEYEDAAAEWAAAQSRAESRRSRTSTTGPSSEHLDGYPRTADGDEDGWQAAASGGGAWQDVESASPADLDPRYGLRARNAGAPHADESRSGAEAWSAGSDTGEHVDAADPDFAPDGADGRDSDDHAVARDGGDRSPDEDVDEFDDERMRPVPRRPGRGGYDPEAAEATRAYRYQQRRRVTLALLIASVAFSVLALLVLPLLWVAAGASILLLVGYLIYLRRQVKIENEIRDRRMTRMQRARQLRPEYRTGAGAPPRRVDDPSRQIVDLDDDDPGFDDLERHEPITYRRAAGQ